MSRGLTIADFVQQVLYSIFKVRFDVNASKEGAFHSKTDKFKEVVMEANFVLQEFQKEQDWHFLRDRWEMGFTRNPIQGIQEFQLPEDVYKVCTGYNDAIRLHRINEVMPCEQIPFEEARSGNMQVTDMFDEYGRLNVDNQEQRAFCVGDTITFYRPWFSNEQGLLVETDVIRLLEPLHICDDNCPDNCPLAYEELHFTEVPDPYYLIVRTAAKRAAAFPDAIDTAQALTDEASKFLSAMRENDSAHTTTDTYQTSQLGYISIL